MRLTYALSLKYRINTLGILSALLFFYISLSNKPWWTITGGLNGEHSFSAEISPFTFEAQILGKPLTLPIMPYLILASKLTMLLAAATILTGSFLPTKPWSKPLMSIRGALLPIIFPIGISIGLQMVRSYTGMDIPIVGNFTLNYSISHDHQSISTHTPSTTALTPEYWIALAAGAIAVLARILQSKILASTTTAKQ